MRKSLITQLQKMDEAEYHELKDQLEKATWIRNIERGFTMTTEELAKAIKINPERLIELRQGGTAFKQDEIAKLRAYDLEEGLKRGTDQMKAQRAALEKQLKAEKQRQNAIRDAKRKAAREGGIVDLRSSAEA